MYNSVNQYFPNGQGMFQNHAWVEEPFKVQSRSKDFSKTE